MTQILHAPDFLRFRLGNQRLWVIGGNAIVLALELFYEANDVQRRHFSNSLALALASPWQAVMAQKKSAQQDAATPWLAIEAGVGGRLGVAVLDTATGQTTGRRLDERFPMCSTFKWLAAALVLQRVDAGKEQLDRLIRYGSEVLVDHSPVTEQHVTDGMTLAALCESTVTQSDNAAANLILDSFGGPPAVTAFARSLGDDKTRLDRNEPALNEARPGDPRDTTTPRAMATAMRSAALGMALSPAGRARLVAWLESTRTGQDRLRAALPADWRAGDKTGTGDRGTTNDVAVFWPPRRAPLVVAAYLTDCKAAREARNAALADVGRAVIAQVLRST